jgi:hypothetical protein
MIKRKKLVSNTSTSRETMLTAEAYQAHEQFLLEEQAVNAETSVTYQVETSKREGQNLEPR